MCSMPNCTSGTMSETNSSGPTYLKGNFYYIAKCNAWPLAIFENMRNRINIAQSVDRISSLPDAVLCHILSFLPTKYAACTSILSTRWRYLFLYRHNLDFDDSLMLHPRRNDQSLDNDWLVDYFMNFVDRYIILSKVTHFDKFYLKCRQVDNPRVNAWICGALARNVRELDVCIPVREPGLLPSVVFTSTTLVVLKLGTRFSLNVPASVFMPCLNCLHLDSIEFPDDISTQRLFSSCPALEDLVITGCSMKNIRVFNLSSPALKRLTMELNDDEFFNYKLALDAPRLIYLKYKDCVVGGYTLKNLHSLFEAYICACYYTMHTTDLDHFMEMIEGIRFVRSLYLCGTCAVNLRYDVLPIFNNMTHLRLQEAEDFYWPLLLKWLHCSPNLEELIFEGSLYDEKPYGDKANNNVPPCMLLHLKAIEFMPTHSWWDWETALPFELRFVEYFLKNSQVLETVRIHIKGRDRYHDLGFVRELLRLPRLSRTCKVEISCENLANQSHA